MQTLDWAARYNTWLPIKLMPKGVVFSFFLFSMQTLAALHQCCPRMDGAPHAHACLANQSHECVPKFSSLLQVLGNQGVQQDLACQLRSQF